MKRIAVVCILILAFAGLADSAYLAQHEVSGAPMLCNVEGLSGCNTVASSQYSYLFGIPVAEYGVLFYSILFALAALELFLFSRPLRRVLQALALIGIVVSILSTLLQAFVINAFCIYCLASAVITVLILIAAGFIEPVWRKKNGDSPIITPPPTPPRLLMPPAP